MQLESAPILHPENKEKILQYLEAMNIYFGESLAGIQSANFEHIYDTDLSKNIQQYIKYNLMLYNHLRPKILEYLRNYEAPKQNNKNVHFVDEIMSVPMPTGIEKFQQLLEIDGYILTMTNINMMDFSVVFSVFQCFYVFDCLLREFCEEKGYTIDKEEPQEIEYGNKIPV